ncbi:hypothetical protein PHLGIDRAFT_412548 [Phlebiopsis gigantea 11061_1 CR5-6]|uniref:BTB domain-containing protein n=1 Tax=Phlebiopsis gigantea (strain 11061_1 CR5-6) TaxID=745531 RepID=A0A0C3RZ56_PHLG1|nr:hypothetical protein PHLGIDRAFT_412548 [Phlebiopsis gigantea 11061_1 CR5-6]
MLYVQDVEGYLREYYFTLSGTVGSTSKVGEGPYASLQSISALADSQSPGLRLYCQTDDMDIVEWTKCQDQWYSLGGAIIANEYSQVLLCAFTRRVESEGAINLYWITSHGVLKQRVWYQGTWSVPLSVCVIRSAEKRLQTEAVERCRTGSNAHGQTAAWTDCTMREVWSVLDPDSEAIHDSYLALRAEDTVFKVQRSVLSQHSSFFADMLSIPQPAEADLNDLYEGVPVVPVAESAQDLSMFLANIYDNHAVASCNGLQLARLLDICTKYQAWRLSQRIVLLLRHEFPDSFDSFSHFVDHHPLVNRTVTDTCRLADTTSALPLFTSTTELITILTSVRRAGLRIVLPAILLRCAMQETNTLLASARAGRLTRDDAEWLRDIQARLAAYAQPKLATMSARFSMECQTRGSCRLRNVDAIRVLFFHPWLTMTGTQWCAGCISNFWQRVCADQQPAKESRRGWESLPSLLGLPSWTDLRQEYAEFCQDSE